MAPVKNKITLLLLTLYCLGLSCAEAKADPGLLFKQLSARYGSVTCMVTPGNFRMDTGEIKVLVKPPFKMVNFYNMASRTTYSATVDYISRDINWHELTPEQTRAHAKERIVPGGDDILQTYALKRYVIEHYAPTIPTLPSLEFWTTRDRDFPHILDDVCCKLSGLPTGYGFPIKIYQVKQRMSRTGKAYFEHFKVLDTSKINKQNFPDTTFAAPVNFKPTHDLMELMVGGGAE